nr:GIY-YIG nuclease family protein [Chelonobacter oris]
MGYTTKRVQERIKEQYPVLLPQQSYRIELDEIAVRNNGELFTDKDVHKVLKKHHIERKNGEWFACDLNAVKAALWEVKTGKKNKQKRTLSFAMLPEQQAAVEKAKTYFERYQSDPKNQGKTPHFLWNAKMRFGKTFAAYQLAKQMGWQKILIMTFKPAVQSAWQEDLQSMWIFRIGSLWCVKANCVIRIATKASRWSVSAHSKIFWAKIKPAASKSRTNGCIPSTGIA